jgi:hypothetical protein
MIPSLGWPSFEWPSYFQDIARFRPELRILISSATLDAEKFSEYFDGANIFYGKLDDPPHFFHC